jgi:hypothetical protein
VTLHIIYSIVERDCSCYFSDNWNLNASAYLSVELVLNYVKTLVFRGTANGLGFRATSHTGLRARDHYMSSTLIGGKGRTGTVVWSELGLYSNTAWPDTKPRDHGIPNAHNHWFILFSHVWGPPWIEIHWDNIWLKARSHMTSHYTWGSMTPLHDFGGVLGRPFNTFLLGSHNSMVTALGLCVKWSLVM